MEISTPWRLWRGATPELCAWTHRGGPGQHTHCVLARGSTPAFPLPCVRTRGELFRIFGARAQQNLTSATHPTPAPAFLPDLLVMRPQCLGVRLLFSKNNV